MFQEVPKNLNFPEMEHRVLAFWEESRAFDKLREKNSGNDRFSFLDGPITANNLEGMAVHHGWGRTYKDLFQRYKAMLGYDQRYQNGFDCQGLWVEVEVEKELGFSSKKDIEEYGVAPFIEKCKDRVRRAGAAVVEKSIRLGQWMDWDNSYWTMSAENNYTIWMFLRTCYERGWIYKGHDVMPWCSRCGTAISEHEIATEGYQDMVHPGIFVRFPLKDRTNESLLVWTTTAWTLTSNVAAAVHPEMTYLKVRQGEEYHYLLKQRREILKGEYEIVEELPGTALVGWTYTGPFDELDAQQGVEHPVIPWKEVSEEEGTGIVHIAPGCGREDFGLSKEFGLAVIAPLDESGYYIEGFNELSGRNVAEVMHPIIENLGEKGLLYKVEDYEHRYPVCWRCDSELVFRLVDEWFISMDELRYEIMEIVPKIRWIPEFGLEREMDWLRNMHDWCISKKRYWGLALPIYACSCGHFEVIESETELKERAVEGWEAFEGHTPHRPWIDAVKIACPKCGETVSRIPDVGTPWLDAGIVPYSTMNYRHDRAYWERWFPVDFITETFALQFRNWFYALLAMSAAMEGKEPFRTVLAHGLILDEHAEEMHKSKGNAIWFDDAVERMGADVMRWLFARTNPATNINFGYGPAEDTKRKFLTFWNTYSFFVTYANLDGFDPADGQVAPDDLSLLDRWIQSKLHALIARTRAALDDYNVMTVARASEEFIEDLSNWYVRRSRRRFWKSESDSDKRAAYNTLYEVLVTFIKLIAPVMPFLAEEVYRNLVHAVDPGTPESIHLCEYPEADAARIDEDLMTGMDLTIRIVSLGRSARTTHRVKVRQPLSEVLVTLRDEDRPEDLLRLEDQIREELNVKKVTIVDDPADLVRFSVKPNFRRLGPRFGKRMPEVKAALEGMDGDEAADELNRTGVLAVELDGERIEITSEEVEIEPSAKEGLIVAEDGGYCVALDVRLTEELEDEGFAREVVHTVQNMRKEAGFEVSDRIDILYNTTERLRRAIEHTEEYIRAETLSVSIKASDEPRGEFRASSQINGEDADIAVRRV